jgi:hypothetical protein
MWFWFDDGVKLSQVREEKERRSYDPYDLRSYRIDHIDHDHLRSFL